MRPVLQFEYGGVNPFGLDYLEMFQKKYFWSIDLQKKETYDSLLEEGFKWIRRDDTRRFELITRRPTIGCYVEVFKVQHLGCVPIVSPQGQKLIRRLCYF
jgi:hypothetical protein